MTTLPTTARTDAPALSIDLAQAGAVFNDATRLLDGGLWSKPADNNNQAAYLGMYTTDIHAVLADINSALANPTEAEPTSGHRQRLREPRHQPGSLRGLIPVAAPHPDRQGCRLAKGARD